MINVGWFLLGVTWGAIIKTLADIKISKGNIRRSGFWIVEFENKLKIEGVFTKMELKEGYRVDVTAKPKTRGGNDAAIEPGSGRFTSSDESIVRVEQNPDDETNASFFGVDGSANESVVVEFRADGIKGEGEREIVISGAITCTQGDAATGEMEFGTPVAVETETQPEPVEPATPAEPIDGDGAGVGTEPGDEPETPADGDDGTTEPAGNPGEDSGDGGPVEPGDPGTVTGEPFGTEPIGEPTIPTPEGVEAGQPAEPAAGVDSANLDPADRPTSGDGSGGSGGGGSF